MLPTILALAAASTTVTDRFDLNCTGTLSIDSLYVNKSEPYSKVYRIDLVQKKWCDGECKALHAIAAVEPTELRFWDEKTDTPSEYFLHIDSVDRQTGVHSILSTKSNPRDRRSILTLKWQGQCEKQKFSGFPEFKTMF